MPPVFLEKTWGISLGQDLLTAVEVTQKLKGYAFRKIVDIPNFSGQEPVELKSGYSVKRDPRAAVVLSLPLSMVMLRTIPYEGSTLEIKSALADQMQSLFPFKGEELYFDVYPLKAGESREALIAAVLKNELDDLLYRLDNIGLKPNRVIIEPLALTCLPVKETGRRMLIGSNNDKLWYSAFQPGLLEGAALLSGAGELKEQLNDRPPDRVWLKGFPERELKRDLPGLPEENIRQLDPVDEALGAGLWHLEHSGPPFDLLGQGPGKNRQLFLAKVLAGVIAALLVFLVCLDIRATNKTLMEIDTRVSRISDEVEKVMRMQEEISGLRDRISLINGINERHVTRLCILKELSRLLPRNAWLRELSVREDHFEMSGEADVATDIIGVLDDSPLIDEVRLKAPVVKSESGGELFRIEARVVGLRD